MTSLTPHDETGRPRMNAREREQFRRELIAAQEKRKAANAARIREKKAARKARQGISDAKRAKAVDNANAETRSWRAGNRKITAGYWKRQVC